MTNKNQTRGFLMAVIGFIFLLINALSYIFSWDIKNPAFTVLGIVFVVIGMGIARKKN